MERWGTVWGDLACWGKRGTLLVTPARAGYFAAKVPQESALAAIRAATPSDSLFPVSGQPSANEA